MAAGAAVSGKYERARYVQLPRCSISYSSLVRVCILIYAEVKLDNTHRGNIHPVIDGPVSTPSDHVYIGRLLTGYV